jgi:hypothetical protein
MRVVSLVLSLLAAPAGALTIQIDSVSLGAGNTADSSNNASATEILTASDSVPDVEGPEFAEVGARWLGTVFANDAVASATADWQIAFTVTADPGVVYNLVILQELVGAFTFLDDDALGSATASVGPLTGTLGGLPNPLLAMPVGVDGTATSATTASIPFQRSRLLELASLVGTQSFTLAFTFDASAQSASDEVAVQLGRAGAIGAAAYPGIGARNASRDGHHVSLSTRVISAPVPEPGTFALLALGLIGFGGRAWRR